MSEQVMSSVMAAYATLKSLSDEKKYNSPYQILREFIRYIINFDSLYSFSTVEMKEALYKHFSFVIPEAVIKTSLKKMEGVSLNNGIYSISLNELGLDSLFEDKKKEADEYSIDIIEKLSEYISRRTGNETISKETLIQELTHFLTGDDVVGNRKYTDIISEFIIKNEDNKDLQDGLSRIREGSILYMGLCYNIGDFGSITKPLTLYLGTEVLFSLLGYNGEIFKQFVDDFYDQIRISGAKRSSKIKLRYFSEIKKEIDEFFSTAGEIVEGRRYDQFNKPAMKAIINGCNTSADVDVKKSDFYFKLKNKFGIVEDDHSNYYDEEYFFDNLESYEYEEDEDRYKKKTMAIKLISHINKLRAGKSYTKDIESEHLIVTNSRVTLLLSKEISDRDKIEKGLDFICNYAVSLDSITSTLWYKLGNGFSSKPYPLNVNAALKARAVLSVSIAKKAEKAFFKAKKEFLEGVIDKDQVVSRIITLRNKPILPEELHGDNIEEVMDFSPEYLSRYEELVRRNESELAEKNDFIRSLQEDTKSIVSEKDTTIILQQDIIKEKEKQNKELQDVLAGYRLQEKEDKIRKIRRKNIVSSFAQMFYKSILMCILLGVIYYSCKAYDIHTNESLGVAIGILSLVLPSLKEIKNIIEECRNKNNMLE